MTHLEGEALQHCQERNCVTLGTPGAWQAQGCTLSMGSGRSDQDGHCLTECLSFYLARAPAPQAEDLRG